MSCHISSEPNAGQHQTGVFINSGDTINWNLYYAGGVGATGEALLTVKVIGSTGESQTLTYDLTGKIAAGTNTHTLANGNTTYAPPADYKTNMVTVNVGDAAVKIVPEPATATLSLLALAGLVARRRRKH